MMSFISARVCVCVFVLISTGHPPYNACRRLASFLFTVLSSAWKLEEEVFFLSFPFFYCFCFVCFCFCFFSFCCTTQGEETSLRREKPELGKPM